MLPPDHTTTWGPERFGLATLAELLEASPDSIFVLNAAGQIVYANEAAGALFGRPRSALVGMAGEEMIAPRMRTQLRENFARSLTGDAGRRATVIVRPDGNERDVEYTSVHLVVSGETLVACIMRDVTDTRRREREATALARAAANLTLDQPIGATLDVLVASIIESTGAEACLIALVGDGTLDLRALATHGFPPAYARAMEERWPVAVAKGANAARAFHDQEQRLLYNARAGTLADPTLAHLHPYLQAAGWDIAVFTPLVYRGRSLGIVASYHPADPPPSEAQLSLLSALTGQAAVAIENANLYYQAQERASLEERQRLARELHDSVSQALYGIALGAKTARGLLDRDPPRAAEPLDYILSLANAGLTEMRALIFELRPEALAQDGLVVALERQVHVLRSRHKLEVNAELGNEPSAPLETKQALYRLAQEALHNAVKHARATSIDIRLESDPAELRLFIRDNGIGFDAGATFPGHFGLRSMQERTSRLGGTTTIESAPGQGCTIRAWLPLRPASVAGA